MPVSEPTRTGASTPTAGWTFLTNHAHVLFCIAEDPEVRLRDVAARVGITEGGGQRVGAGLGGGGCTAGSRGGGGLPGGVQGGAAEPVSGPLRAAAAAPDRAPPDSQGADRAGGGERAGIKEPLMPLNNPYLTFFRSLPAAFWRNPLLPIDNGEMWSPDWLRLKAAVAGHFSWAVPTDEAIAAIRRHTSRVIEIGCGSGYWAWLME